MGAALLRLAKMQEKWRVKLAKALEEDKVTEGGWKGVWKRGFGAKKYGMFYLPFITVVREGLEAVVFVFGVSFQTPAKSIPLPVVCGLIAGFLFGYILYK